MFAKTSVKCEKNTKDVIQRVQNTEDMIQRVQDAWNASSSIPPLGFVLYEHYWAHIAVHREASLVEGLLPKGIEVSYSFRPKRCCLTDFGLYIHLETIWVDMTQILIKTSLVRMCLTS